MSSIDQEVADQPRSWQLAAEAADKYSGWLPPRGARVAAVGCGTSYYIAGAYAALRESLGHGETDAFPASEFALGRSYDVILLITRSGTTTEVLDLAAQLPADARVLALTTRSDVTITERVRRTIPLEFADEKSVVQTRFATSVLALLRAHLGQDVHALARDGALALAARLPLNPEPLEQFVFLGRGFGAALASEAALKMRETGAAWSEAYPAMEFRHGPISTLSSRSLVWCLGTAPTGLAQEVRNTEAQWYENDDDPMVALLLAQRLAVANARAHGLDPGAPRFLARSVILPPEFSLH